MADYSSYEPCGCSSYGGHTYACNKSPYYIDPASGFLRNFDKTIECRGCGSIVGRTKVHKAVCEPLKNLLLAEQPVPPPFNPDLDNTVKTYGGVRLYDQPWRPNA